MENEQTNIDSKLEKMAIPEVKFEIPSLESEINIVYTFCEHKNPSLDFSATVFKRHPKLKELQDIATSEDDFRKLCGEYVTEYLEKNKEIINTAKDNFQKSWNEVGEKALSELCKDFETDFPKDIKKIEANVSINPICPRWINKWSYNLFYMFNDISMKSTSIHEIIHFLYFKKWAEVFPEFDDKHVDSPHSEWILSEILVHTIINGNKILQEILDNHKADVYMKWREVRIDGKTLPEFFAPIYKEHEEGKITFDDFLKKSWKEYKKNIDAIEVHITK